MLNTALPLKRKIQRNREMMRKVLSFVGLINYPTEYWHWSYGDRYWAHQTAQLQAIYGSVE